MLDEPDFVGVDDECEDGKHSSDNSPILKYEDIVVIEFESADKEFTFCLKMYSKTQIGFTFFYFVRSSQ